MYSEPLYHKRILAAGCNKSQIPTAFKDSNVISLSIADCSIPVAYYEKWANLIDTFENVCPHINC